MSCLGFSPYLELLCNFGYWRWKLGRFKFDSKLRIPNHKGNGVTRAMSHYFHLPYSHQQTNTPWGWWKTDQMLSPGAWMAHFSIEAQSFLIFDPPTVITQRPLLWLSASVSCQVCKFMSYMTCACMLCNQTLFKQSTSETEGSERVDSDYFGQQGSFINQSLEYVLLWMDNSKQVQTNTQNSPNFNWKHLVSGATVWHKHSLPEPSVTGTFTDPWVFPTLPLNLFALNSPQLCNMELWLLAQSLRGHNSGSSVCRGTGAPSVQSNTAQLESFSDSWMARGVADKARFLPEERPTTKNSTISSVFCNSHWYLGVAGFAWISSHCIIGKVMCWLSEQ